jgi:hypothetical protein
MADAENADPPGGARPSRRAFLLGGGAAVVAGAGAGVGVEFWRDRPRPAPKPPRPAVLVAALAGERGLIAALDAALPGAGADRATLRAVRSDHVAHERALATAVAQAGRADLATPAPAAASSAPASPAPSTPPPDAAALRRAETAASRRAAARAGRLSGRDATLLASIAASEAGHAELLA